jgi:hypothetical protein
MLKPLRNLIKYILRHFPNRASAIDFDRDVAPHAIRWRNHLADDES